MTHLSDLVAIAWVFIGILVSLLLPIAVGTLSKVNQKQTTASGEKITIKPTLGQRIAAAWRDYGGKKYLGILLAAAFIAAVIVVMLKLEFTTQRDAALAGFAWESFVKKLFAGQQ